MSVSQTIVVGFDGSDTSRRAVEYAAAAALARSLALQIIHCHAWSPSEAGRTEATRRTLARLSEQLQDEYPRLAIGTAMVSRSPAATLIGESRTAAMVVVAHEGAGTFGDVHTGAVARQVAGQASCPVAVIRGSGTHPDGPVLLAVDAAETEPDALAFGFAQATRAGVALRAVYLSGPRPDRTPGERNRRSAGTVPPDEALTPWRDRYPDVTASTEQVEYADAVRHLTAASSGASLLVVGTRAAGTDRGVRLGSLHGPLLTATGCPVVIVNEPRTATADGAPESGILLRIA